MRGFKIVVSLILIAIALSSSVFAVFNDSLIGYWSFDNAESEVLSDRGNQSWTFSNASWIVGDRNCRVGNCANIYRANSTGTISNNLPANVLNVTVGTIMFWIREENWTSPLPQTNIFCKNGCAFRHQTGGTTGNNYFQSNSNSTLFYKINPMALQLMVYTWNSTERAIWVGNVTNLSKVNYSLGVNFTVPTTTPLYFGVNGVNANERLNGSIDELYLFNRVIDFTEMNCSYNGFNGANYSAIESCVSPASPFDITSCRDINSSGTYNLMVNLTNCSMNVTASNVTFEGNGYVINNTFGGPVFGGVMQFIDVVNVTVKNLIAGANASFGDYTGTFDSLNSSVSYQNVSAYGSVPFQMTSDSGPPGGYSFTNFTGPRIIGDVEVLLSQGSIAYVDLYVSNTYIDQLDGDGNGYVFLFSGSASFVNNTFNVTSNAMYDASSISGTPIFDRNLYLTYGNDGFSNYCIDNDYDGICDSPYEVSPTNMPGVFDNNPRALYIGQNATTGVGPTLSSASFTPVYPYDGSTLTAAVVCYDSANIVGHVQFYVGGVLNGTEQNATVANNTNTTIGTVSPSLTSPGQNWTAEMWCSNSFNATNKTNITRMILDGAVYLLVPSNGTVVANTSQQFQFLVNSTINDSWECNLTIDGVIRGNSSGYTNDTITITNSTYMSSIIGNGIFKDWSVSCVDGGGYTNSSTSQFRVIYQAAADVATPTSNQSIQGPLFNVTLNSRNAFARIYVLQKGILLANDSTSNLYIPVNLSAGQSYLYVVTDDISGFGNQTSVSREVRVSNLGTVTNVSSDKSFYWVRNESPIVRVNVSSLEGYVFPQYIFVQAFNSSWGLVSQNNYLIPRYNISVPRGTRFGSADWGQTFIAQGDLLVNITTYMIGCGLGFSLLQGDNMSGAVLASSISASEISNVRLVPGQEYTYRHNGTCDNNGYFVNDTDPGNYSGGHSYVDGVARYDIDIAMDVLFANSTNFSVSGVFNQTLNVSSFNVTFIGSVYDGLFNITNASTGVKTFDALANAVIGYPVANSTFGGPFNMSIYDGGGVGEHKYLVEQSFNNGSWAVFGYQGVNSSTLVVNESFSNLSNWTTSGPVTPGMLITTSAGSAYRDGFPTGDVALLFDYNTTTVSGLSMKGGFTTGPGFSGDYVYIRAIQASRQFWYYLGNGVNGVLVPPISTSAASMFHLKIVVHNQSNTVDLVVYDSNYDVLGQVLNVSSGFVNTTRVLLVADGGGGGVVQFDNLYVYNRTYLTNLQFPGDVEGQFNLRITGQDEFISSNSTTSGNFQIVLNPNINDAICQVLTYPNELDEPVQAYVPVNFSVNAPMGFNGSSVQVNISYGARFISSSNCNYTVINAQNREYRCLIPMSFYYAPGGYTGNISFVDPAHVALVNISGSCSYASLLATRRYTTGVTFPTAAPGVQNASSNVPVVFRNTGNVPINISLKAYDLIGLTVPSAHLLASVFRAGSNLTGSAMLQNNTAVPLNITMAPGANSNASFWLWVTMPTDIVIQSYYSQQFWEVIGNG